MRYKRLLVVLTTLLFLSACASTSSRKSSDFLGKVIVGGVIVGGAGKALRDNDETGEEVSDEQKAGVLLLGGYLLYSLLKSGSQKQEAEAKSKVKKSKNKPNFNLMPNIKKLGKTLAENADNIMLGGEILGAVVEESVRSNEKYAKNQFTKNTSWRIVNERNAPYVFDSDKGNKEYTIECLPTENKVGVSYQREEGTYRPAFGGSHKTLSSAANAGCRIY